MGTVGPVIFLQLVLNIKYLIPSETNTPASKGSSFVLAPMPCGPENVSKYIPVLLGLNSCFCRSYTICPKL